MKAKLENEDTVSESVVEPTLTALDIQAGEPMALVKPLLPEAITVAIPAAFRLSITALWPAKLASQLLKNWPPPRLMFTEAKLRVPWQIRPLRRSRSVGARACLPSAPPLDNAIVGETDTRQVRRSCLFKGFQETAIRKKGNLLGRGLTTREDGQGGNVDLSTTAQLGCLGQRL